jgi:hypothetical protein
MRSFIKGAIRELAIEVRRKSCEDEFTIESGSYEVKNSAMEVVQEGTLFIDGHRASFLVDTTLEGYVINQTYTPYWTIAIAEMEKVIIEKISPFVITE